MQSPSHSPPLADSISTSHVTTVKRDGGEEWRNRSQMNAGKSARLFQTIIMDLGEPDGASQLPRRFKAQLSPSEELARRMQQILVKQRKRLSRNCLASVDVYVPPRLLGQLGEDHINSPQIFQPVGKLATEKQIFVDGKNIKRKSKRQQKYQNVRKTRALAQPTTSVSLLSESW